MNIASDVVTLTYAGHGSASRAVLANQRETTAPAPRLLPAEPDEPDQIDISKVARELARLLEEEPELQLPPERLQELTE